MGYNY